MDKKATSRRVVVTGLSALSALGVELDSLSVGTLSCRTGVRSAQAHDIRTLTSLAPVDAFTGKIQEFGEMPDSKRKAIRKGVKLMAREIQLGVAAAQLALQHSGYDFSTPSGRVGVAFASDYIVTTPQELVDAIKACRQKDEQGEYYLDFPRWRADGLTKMTPIWQLKYLTNMSASHITIYNEFFGPAFDVTNRESSFCTALAEATSALRSGRADVMVVGATGSKLHPVRLADALKYDQISPNALGQGERTDAPAKPYDAMRNGSVPGEGAGAVILETYEHAKARGAKIYAEVVAGAYRASYRHERDCGGSNCDLTTSVDSLRESFELTLRAIVADADLHASDLAHINGASRGETTLDAAEALALRKVFGSDLDNVALTSLGGHIGNPGAGGGAIATVASILALQEGAVFPTFGFSTCDPALGVQPVTQARTTTGDYALKLCGNTLGQTSGVLLKRWNA